jgi:hypothetical protein
MLRNSFTSVTLHGQRVNRDSIAARSSPDSYFGPRVKAFSFPSISSRAASHASGDTIDGVFMATNLMCDIAFIA